MPVEILEEEYTPDKPGSAFTLQEWIATPPEVFDATEVYNAEIMPLVKQVEELCHKHRVPFYFRATLQADLTGCQARTTLFLGGLERATPELLAAARLEEFSMDYIGSMLSLLGACKKKYSRLQQEDEGVDNRE
jgi:hypothetical protein